MNNKQIFDKLTACGFRAPNFESDAFFQTAWLVITVMYDDLQEIKNSDQLKHLLISRTRNAKETAIAACDAIEKKIREVFDER